MEPQLQKTYAHPSWIEIDEGQFRKNLAIIRLFIGNKRFCLPIKANAYGHGLYEIARIAQDSQVDYLAVAHLQEAAFLRDQGIHLPIIVLGAIHEDQIEDLVALDLEFTVSSLYKAKLVVKECMKLGKKCRVHIEVDTGMRRTGVRDKSALELFLFLKVSEYCEVIGIYSHFAISDSLDEPLAKKQMGLFLDLLKDPAFENSGIIRHLANSGGLVFQEESYLDMVRPGLISFGYIPDGCPAGLRGIKPIFTLKSKIAYFKVVDAGEGISYGHTYITKKSSRIVTIPVGYGDGYRRCLSNRGRVLIRGKSYPIVGTICMDQFMVDIGDDTAYVGDEVVLIGKQGDQEISLMEIAQLCETIPYEVLCLFNDRIPRVYSF